jgi:hypothetical protein
MCINALCCCNWRNKVETQGLHILYLFELLWGYLRESANHVQQVVAEYRMPRLCQLPRWPFGAVAERVPRKVILRNLFLLVYPRAFYLPVVSAFAFNSVHERRLMWVVSRPISSAFDVTCGSRNLRVIGTPYHGSVSIPTANRINC